VVTHFYIVSFLVIMLIAYQPTRVVGVIIGASSSMLFIFYIRGIIKKERERIENEATVQINTLERRKGN
jgi:hypothetical protein